MSFSKEPFRKWRRTCKRDRKRERETEREFDLRYVNSAPKFGEKNPTENG